MAQLVINVQESNNLEELLNVLKRLKISFIQTEDNSPIVTKTPSYTEGYLSVDTIKKLYPNQWVLVSLSEKDDDETKGGIVLFHHSNLRELALKGKDFIQNHAYTTHFYTGEFPKNRKIGVIKKIS